MNNTELTDEPCPECGVSLNVVETPPHGVPAFTEEREGERSRRKTLPQARFVRCPACGWTVPG